MHKKYLLDSNIFIEPSRIYYPFDLAPGFWYQMEKAILSDNVLILDVVYNEIVKGADELASWLEVIIRLNKVITSVQPIIEAYGRVLSYISTCGLYKQAAIDTWSGRTRADLWLIVTAIDVAREQEVIIITFEKSVINISTKRQTHSNAKIPDVAANFNIACENLYYFMREMGIKWK